MDNDESQMPDGVAEFLRMFDEMKRKMDAIDVLTQIIRITEEHKESHSEEEAMEQVLNVLLSYGDRCVMNHLSKDS